MGTKEDNWEILARTEPQQSRHDTTRDPQNKAISCQTAPTRSHVQKYIFSNALQEEQLSCDINEHGHDRIYFLFLT